jgi:DNA-binding transcriptional ArsR family regulator
MPTQHQLDFGTGLVATPVASSRATDPTTSKEAAERVEASGAADCQRAKCLAVVRATPGMTACEIAEAAGIDRYAASRRLPELRKAGLVVNGLDRKCSVRGTNQMTWFAT